MRRFTASAVSFIISVALAGGAASVFPHSDAAAQAVQSGAPDRIHLSRSQRSLPLMFVENAGQFDDRARFQVRGRSATLWLAEDAIWVTVVSPSSRQPPSPAAAGEGGDAPLAPPRPQPWARGPGGEGHGVNLKLSFVGANPHPRLEPFNRLDTHVSHFLGNDPARWHADVPVWGGVRYLELYPGIDLELTDDRRPTTDDRAGPLSAVLRSLRTGRPSAVSLRLIAHAGADSSLVRLRIEGAERVTLDGDRLRATTAIGPIFLTAILTGDGTPLRLTVKDGTIAYAPQAASPFNPFRPEPAKESVDSAPIDSAINLLYSTFLGGGDVDEGDGVAVDADGAAYVTGRTASPGFPTTPGVFQAALEGGFDAFVTKLNPAGDDLVYSTFLGGSADDWSWGIALDGTGAAYVTGKTYSPDFPVTTGAFQGACHGCPDYDDGFIVKLNASGTDLVYSTFLGGSHMDEGYGIIADAAGLATVTGDTYSSDYPTTPGAFQTTWGGGTCYGIPCPDAFVFKLSADGSTPLFSTYLGGSNLEGGYGIAMDSSSAVYISNFTHSPDFPTTRGAFQTTCASCPAYTDTYVAKLSPDGSRLIYSTFVGGSSSDTGHGLAIDATGAAYVTGYTRSSDFPVTPGAFQTTQAGDRDAFLAKLNPAGSGLEYGTYLGGSGPDWGYGTVVDAGGVAYVTGNTASPDFPVTPWAFQVACASCPDYTDVFATKLSAPGSGLIYSTYLGGSGEDWGWGDMTLDASGAAFLTGYTTSPDFPVSPGAFQTVLRGPQDAFVTKPVLLPLPYRVYLPAISNNR